MNLTVNSSNQFVDSSSAVVKAPTYNLRLVQPNYWNKPNPSHEEQLLARWAEMDLQRQLRESRSGRPVYWLLDGPPYANGDAHLGHLLNKTLKDVNARFACLTGHQVVWRAGWDCHGLPLELAVEKRHGSGAKEDPFLFMSQCRKEAETWKGVQAKSMARAGLLADMETPWMTMDPKRESKALGLLRDLWSAGLLVERHSPVHWCPACQSALAASELEKSEKQRLEALFTTDLSTTTMSQLLDMAAKKGVAWPTGPLQLLSWTTTPWTLWANAGFGYPMSGSVTVATLKSGVRAMVAVAARDNLVSKFPDLFSDLGCEFDGSFDFAEFPAMALSALSPLTNLEAPLFGARFANGSEGSGFVHLAPAFGPDDYEMHETSGVRLDCHVTTSGRLVDGNSEVQMPESLLGKTLDEASVASCELLGSSGRLAKAFSTTAETNMCWRHKKAVFFRASQQWALDLHKGFADCDDGLAARATAALEKTKFVPDDRAKQPLETMLATRRFWTLSRDRLWGLPLPFFRHKDTGDLHPETDRMWRDLVVQVEQYGVEAWQSVEAPQGYLKTNQSVDVWFDSGAAWLTAKEAGLSQVDMVVEGRDQTRGWFLSSYLLHAFVSPLPPFKRVTTHSFVVDENGHKLSKSKGGTPDTKALFQSCGADVFRHWVCSQNVGDESRWSKTSLAQATQEVKDWRSFLRFHLSNMGHKQSERPGSLRPMDQLALAKLAVVRVEWHGEMRAGKFNQALHTLSQFRQWASTEWFDLSKRTLYCSKTGCDDLLSVQWTLQQTFMLFAQMLSPFLPFAAEEAYLAWDGREHESLFLHVLESADFEFTEASASAQRLLASRRALLPLVERARDLVEKGTPVSLVLPLEMLEKNMPTMYFEDVARELFPGSFVRFGSDATTLEVSLSEVVNGCTVFAGKSSTSHSPHRCNRCRGYFSKTLSSNGLCQECVAEMT